MYIIAQVNPFNDNLFKYCRHSLSSTLRLYSATHIVLLTAFSGNDDRMCFEIMPREVNIAYTNVH